eukprot:2154426-Alexandrium_andersonii.AAC.1
MSGRRPSGRPRPLWRAGSRTSAGGLKWPCPSPFGAQVPKGSQRTARHRAKPSSASGLAT